MFIDNQYNILRNFEKCITRFIIIYVITDHQGKSGHAVAQIQSDMDQPTQEIETEHEPLVHLLRSLILSGGRIFLFYLYFLVNFWVLT